MLNGTGDPAVADDVVAHLAAAGLTVGSVAGTESATSAVQFPDGAQSSAQWLADVLGAAHLVTPGAVPHVTVVLGSDDAAAVVAAVDALPACG